MVPIDLRMLFISASNKKMWGKLLISNYYLLNAYLIQTLSAIFSVATIKSLIGTTIYFFTINVNVKTTINSNTKKIKITLFRGIVWEVNGLPPG